MRRAALALLLLLAVPVAAQMSTGGGPKDSPPYDNEVCAFFDTVGDSLGFVAWDNIVAWGYDPPNPAAINVDGRLLFGELYVDNTLARVIIGDASTWAKVRHWEIQPATAWADGEITITLNQGSFVSSASAWLYIVNSDGLYNSQGYPLIIGSSVAPVPPSPNKTPGYQFNEYPAEP